MKKIFQKLFLWVFVYVALLSSCSATFDSQEHELYLAQGSASIRYFSPDKESHKRFAEDLRKGLRIEGRFSLHQPTDLQGYIFSEEYRLGSERAPESSHSTSCWIVQEGKGWLFNIQLPLTALHSLEGEKLVLYAHSSVYVLEDKEQRVLAFRFRFWGEAFETLHPYVKRALHFRGTSPLVPLYEETPRYLSSEDWGTLEYYAFFLDGPSERNILAPFSDAHMGRYQLLYYPKSRMKVNQGVIVDFLSDPPMGLAGFHQDLVGTADFQHWHKLLFLSSNKPKN